jgi:hypothetical protein
VIGDLGTGSGYFTFRLARHVGDTGRVYAADVSPEMIVHLNRRIRVHRPLPLDGLDGLDKSSNGSGALLWGKVAGVAGLEPVTSAVTGQRSNQLSYTPTRAEAKLGILGGVVNG